MKTSLFDFDLPESLIATEPANPRDSARLLVIPSPLSSEFHDATVRDFPSFLKPNDIVVFNDTRVIPARLLGRRGDAKIEVLLHRHCQEPKATRQSRLDCNAYARNDVVWSCFAKPAKKLKMGDEIIFADDFSAKVLEKLPDGQVVLGFEAAGFFEKLHAHGHMPLPPYIARADHAADKHSYQTVYAKHEGSVAAPTAGLHFTPELLAAIDATGAKRVHITLHVGGGTFLPVKVDDTSEHIMHSEWAEVSPQAAEIINSAKRVIAVGTTSLRTLESSTDANGITHAFSGETNIFITPGYAFKCVDVLLTNFHLPKSTLFMLVSAFSGLETMKKAYAHAIQNRYRFYSYGDACLLIRSDSR